MWRSISLPISSARWRLRPRSIGVWRCPLRFGQWAMAHCLSIIVPASGPGGAGAGRCPRRDDGPHCRQLYQYRHGQAVQPCRPRRGLRPRRHGWVLANRLPPDASCRGAGCQREHAQFAADGCGGRDWPVAVAGRGAGAWGFGGCDPAGLAAWEHVALGDVGIRGPVREYRHGARRSVHLVATAQRGRAGGCRPVATDQG